MKSTAFGNPFFIWTELAMRSTEMMLASAQVIGHRVQLMAAAGHNPSVSDQREMSLMVNEKTAAVAESAMAVASGMARMNFQFAVQAFTQMTRVWTGMFAMGMSRGPTQSLQTQTRLLTNHLARSVAASSRLSESTAELAHKALKPIHRRATANAKRLGKKR
ncbi:MAG: polyhydroxyalkanoate granule-associated phasin [Betaproteobacteria bacterium]